MRGLINILAVFGILGSALGLGFLNKKVRYSTQPTVENRFARVMPWVKHDWYKTDAEGNILAAVGCANRLGIIQTAHDPAPGAVNTNAATAPPVHVGDDHPQTNVDHLELAIQEGLAPAGFDQAVAATQDELYVIIDARTDLEFRDGHLPRAEHIPYETAIRESLAGLLGEITEDFSRPTLVYCGDKFCPKAFELTRYLVELGHGSVELYAEGFQDWQNNGGEVAR